MEAVVRAHDTYSQCLLGWARVVTLGVHAPKPGKRQANAWSRKPHCPPFVVEAYSSPYVPDQHQDLPPKRGTMRTPNQSDLESLIAAAEAEATESLRAAPTPDQYPALRRSRDRISTLVTDALARIDVNGSELDQLQREHTAELRRIAEDAKSNAIGRSEGASRRIEAAVTVQRDALALLPFDPLDPTTHLLLSALFVRSSPTGENLGDSHLEPGLNWAKWRCQVSGDAIRSRGAEKVSFYILWQNPREVAVLADILVRLTINGHCECNADGTGVASWFFPDSQSEVDISAQLTIWPLWLSHAPRLPVAITPIADVSAGGGFFGDSNEESISAAPAVMTTQFAIPANAYILIEASVVAEYDALNGSVDVDFASGDLFNVGFAYGAVTLPPEMKLSP